MKFQFDPAAPKVALNGNITEETDFTPLAEKLSTGSMLIDLAGINRINSSGARQWVNFIRAVPPSVQVTLDRCSVSFVSQLNMISNFAGSAQVQSIHVPYLCQACGELREDVVAVSALKAGLPTPEKCAECGGQMELDALEEQYFSFLKP